MFTSDLEPCNNIYNDNKYVLVQYPIQVSGPPRIIGKSCSTKTTLVVFHVLLLLLLVNYYIQFNSLN